MNNAKLRIVVLGAGFGGLELTTLLSDALGNKDNGLDLTLIDQSDSFYFGFSKLDVMFGRKSVDAVKIPYAGMVKPGVKFRRERIAAIDPIARKVTTDQGVHEADILVVALGADYDVGATPGLVEGGNEFYTMEGAQKLRNLIPAFNRGHAIVGVTSAPFKCPPPAPSEAALMLHDDLVRRGVRGDCQISLVIPFGLPIPPSPDTSKALIRAFEERDIRFVPKHNVASLDPARKVAVLEDGTEMPYDLFLGIPMHRAPDVLKESGLLEKGWIPVDRKNLKTRFDKVYAIGDVTSVGTPKAGVFAEGAAKVAAASILAELSGLESAKGYAGDGSCYVEFGGGMVGRVDVDFFSGSAPKGVHVEASKALVAEKEVFGSSRKARWFGV